MPSHDLEQIKSVLETKKADELRILCRDLGLSGYSDQTRAGLVALLMLQPPARLASAIKLTWWSRNGTLVKEVMGVLGFVLAVIGAIPVFHWMTSEPEKTPQVSRAPATVTPPQTVAHAAKAAKPESEVVRQLVEALPEWRGATQMDVGFENDKEVVTVYPVKCNGGPADGVWFPLLEDPQETFKRGATPLTWAFDLKQHALTLSEREDRLSGKEKEQFIENLENKKLSWSVSLMDAAKTETTSIGVYKLTRQPKPALFSLQFVTNQELTSSHALDVKDANPNAKVECVGGPLDGKPVTLIQPLDELGSFVWLPTLSVNPPTSHRGFSVLGESLRSPRKPLLIQLSLYERVGDVLEYRGFARSDSLVTVTGVGKLFEHAISVDPVQ